MNTSDPTPPKGAFVQEFKKNLTGEVSKNSPMAFYRRRLFVSAVVTVFVLLAGLITSGLHLIFEDRWGSTAVPLYLLIAVFPAGYLTYRIGRTLHQKLLASLVP